MAEAEKLQVLVVSRDEAVLDDARFGFPSHVEITTATDATDAARQLENLRPSVVIVDQRTGNAGGFALATDMSQINALREIPILVLLERDQDAWLAREVGATMHRTKPIAAEALAADALSLVS
ncbi:MAG: hypothetical protein KY391_07360 [Actinobacteria bacterium]|nr:hypothetical protein [Actinomycetota bacterium]